jgi:hypothetical protein
MRRTSIGLKNNKDRKLAAKWEGPFRIIKTTSIGAYALETLSGVELPRTFNDVDLRRYYS